MLVREPSFWKGDVIMAAQLVPDPTIHRRQLRNQLRSARNQAGRTPEEASAALGWSVSELISVEDDATATDVERLRALLASYEVPAERVSELIRPVEAGPWARWKGVVSPEFYTYLSYEAATSTMRNFESDLVPGLLQIPQYAAALLTSMVPQDVNDALVDLRMQRQETALRTRRPELHFIVDENVIRRQVGGPGVMRQQIQHLLELAEEPNITLGIVPFDQGAYPKMGTAYALFEFSADQDQDVLYIETPLGEKIIMENSPRDDESVTPMSFLKHFRDVERMAAPAAARALLHNALKSFS